MKRLLLVLLLATAAGAAAQQPGDTATQKALLRQLILERWAQHVRTTLGLNDDQAAKLRATEQRYEEQRQPIRARQREINQELQTQLQSAAPDQDRVSVLMNERQENQQKLQQINDAEDTEMRGYLTPVQRARYQEERRRFVARVTEIVRRVRERRGMQGRGGRRPPP